MISRMTTTITGRNVRCKHLILKKCWPHVVLEEEKSVTLKEVAAQLPLPLVLTYAYFFLQYSEQNFEL